VSRKIQKNGGRKSASEIGALVDKGVRRHSDILKGQEAIKEIRDKFKQAGRLDLARKYLKLPTELRELADVLWYNKPLGRISWEKRKVRFSWEKKIPASFTKKVTFSLKAIQTRKTEPASATNFPLKQFTLIRSDGAPGEKITGKCSDRQPAVIMRGPPPTWPLKAAAIAKVASNFFERSKAAQRTRTVFSSPAAALKEMVIQLAPLLFTFEECACMFPDAALAGDYDFIERTVTRYRQPDPLEDRDVRSMGLYWYGFEALGAADVIPPLRQWSDKAQCEFVRWHNGPQDDKLKLGAYRERKTRLGLHSEKPTLVTWAEYIREGDRHCLMCKR